MLYENVFAQVANRLTILYWLVHFHEKMCNVFIVGCTDIVKFVREVDGFGRCTLERDNYAGLTISSLGNSMIITKV